MLEDGSFALWRSGRDAAPAWQVGGNGKLDDAGADDFARLLRDFVAALAAE